MADRSRERNSAGVFSDYGLDERQKLIMANIGFKGFRLMCYSIAAVSAVLLALYIFEINIPFQYAALIYYTVMLIGMAAFEITASKYGVLNQVHCFSNTTGGLITGIILLAAAAVNIIVRTVRGTFSSDTVIIVIICVLTAILQFIRCACGKRNFKVSDEQSEETEDD
ncbi:MAG: hypothetical protein SOU50_09110 [Oscillospiraceae bacterium]|nr:hypothetical protein [Oscillospiraceae bacterium]